MRVLVVGAASWNTIVHVPRLPEPVPQMLVADRSYETVGGTAAGKALNLARLGHDVELHTVLGDDEAGRRVLDALAAGGVRVHARPDAGATEQHVNLMDRDGRRLSVYRSIARPREPLDPAALVAAARECDAVSVDIAEHARPLVPALVAAGVPFWTDLHDWDGRNEHHRDFTAAACITLSHDNLPDPGPVCEALARTAELVACTRGAAGATGWADGGSVAVEAVPGVAVVDTNGAGDAFAAGLMHARHAGWPLERCLRAAAAAGATAVATTGLASPSLTAELLAAA